MGLPICAPYTDSGKVSKSGIVRQHDAGAWESLSVETQEQVIGRRKIDSVESA